MFDRIKDLFEKKFVKYEAESTEYSNVFRLKDEMLYVSVHFENGVFKDPNNKNKIIELNNYLSLLKKKFGVNNIILSCCYPAQAKSQVSNIEGVDLLFEDWYGEVKTVFDNRKGIIKVQKVAPSV